ncbi:MAG: hypothetical protein IJG68_02120 [Bacilli bacterium]|nr:hypothetical protein [Bacilli bacterium]
MNYYDFINIGNVDIEKAIQDSISEVKDELKDLTQERTCRIYCSHLSHFLHEKHVLHRILDTMDFDYPYSHQFIVVPINQSLEYVLDLTFEQFQNDSFPQILKEGYQKMTREQVSNYLDITGNSSYKMVHLEENMHKTVK